MRSSSTTSAPTSPTSTSIPRSMPAPMPRPRKYLHEMNSAERLEALKEWAEEKKYVRPGEAGTFAGCGGIKSLALGGPMYHIPSRGQVGDRWGGQYEGRVGPPSYAFTVAADSPGPKPSAFKKWLEKKRVSREKRRNASLPGYMP